MVSTAKTLQSILACPDWNFFNHWDFLKVNGSIVIKKKKKETKVVQLQLAPRWRWDTCALFRAAFQQLQGDGRAPDCSIWLALLCHPEGHRSLLFVYGSKGLSKQKLLFKLKAQVGWPIAHKMPTLRDITILCSLILSENKNNIPVSCWAML